MIFFRSAAHYIFHDIYKYYFVPYNKQKKFGRAQFEALYTFVREKKLVRCPPELFLFYIEEYFFSAI